MTATMHEQRTGPSRLARAVASVPRSLAEQHHGEVVIQRIRYLGLGLALGLTVVLDGGPGGRLWLAVAAMALSVLIAEVLLRGTPTIPRVTGAGVLSFGLDAIAVTITLLTVSQDPADPIVVLAVFLALEAAVRWQVLGALVGTALGVPLVLLWRMLAHGQATGATPPVEYLVFQASVLALIALLVGSMVRRTERERHRAQQVLRHTPELIVTLDAGGRITSANAAAQPLLGRSPERLLGRSWTEVLGTETSQISDPSAPRAPAAGAGAGLALQRLRRTDGTYVWLEISVRDDPVEGRRTLVARDVTERARTDRELAASEQRLRALFDNNLDAVFGFDIDGTLTEVNPAAEALFQRSRRELLGLHGLDLIESAYRDQARIGLGEALAGAAVHLEVLLVHPGGGTAHADTDLIPIIVDGGVVGVFGMARDVTERKRREAYLEYRVQHDLLTGLANRASLLHAARRHQEAGGSTGLLFLDLDGFKGINDTHGHNAGDEVLITVARRLQAAVREQDLICRLGGDEFCVLMAPAEPTLLQAVGERVARSVQAPIPLDDGEVTVGVSIGAALSRPGEDIRGLLARADAAMYTIKEHRRLPHEDEAAPTVLLAR